MSNKSEKLVFEKQRKTGIFMCDSDCYHYFTFSYSKCAKYNFFYIIILTIPEQHIFPLSAEKIGELFVHSNFHCCQYHQE